MAPKMALANGRSGKGLTDLVNGMAPKFATQPYFLSINSMAYDH
jgi:hypothetical protein